ncbi:MAG TPA: hypothetical protein VEZ40_20130 [Pyrinomonadaceae bacterium]|nr:hypothetical protein [Pyrinomonadaceae bacterium]
MNREFLRERRTQLSAVLQKRVSALRQYLSTAGDALKPQERQVVEGSIRALIAEAESVPTIDARADLHAEDGGRIAVEPAGNAARQGGALSSAVAAPAAVRGYVADSLPVLNVSLQEGSEEKLGSEEPEPETVADKEKAVKAAGGKPVTVDLREYRVPKPVEVPNGTAVTFIMVRRPVNTCTVTTKREELKPEPHPLAQFLGVVRGFAPLPFFKDADERTAAPKEICEANPAPVPKVSAEAGGELKDSAEAVQVEIEMAYARNILISAADDLKDWRAGYSSLHKDIENFTGCENGICDDTSGFDEVKKTLRGKVKTTLEADFPSVESAEVQMGKLKKTIADGYKKTVKPSAPGTPDARKSDEERWLTSVEQRLNCLARNLEVIKKERESLLAAHADLQKFSNLLQSHGQKPDGQSRIYDSKRLVADRGAKVTGAIACTNYFTKQPAVEEIRLANKPDAQGGGVSTRNGKAEKVTVEQVPSTVTYQNKPSGAVSAGVLFTPLDKRQIGSVTVATGTDATGTNFRTTFNETDRADSQLVPFMFYNQRLLREGKFSLNGSGGIGVNPHNGANQVEYFFGGSVGISNFFIQFGGHVGRWQELGGGFALGAVLPANTNPAAPIVRRYTIRPSVGVSYKIPLP